MSGGRMPHFCNCLAIITCWTEREKIVRIQRFCNTSTGWIGTGIRYPGFVKAVTQLSATTRAADPLKLAMSSFRRIYSAPGDHESLPNERLRFSAYGLSGRYP